MLSVTTALTRVVVGLALAAIITASASTVTWSAPAPGADLQPVGDAAERVMITQDGADVVWVSEDGPVATVMTLGWEVQDGNVELGGAMTLETVYRTTGEIGIGEPPKSVSFTFES